MSNKAIFLDRDDTLIDDPGTAAPAGQIHLLPGAPEALNQLKKMGYLLVIVTVHKKSSQGTTDDRQLDEIHHQLKNVLSSKGISIDGIYDCHFHSDTTVKDYSTESNLPKTDSGILESAAVSLDIDLTQSWMIGDSYRDVKAGKLAGCRTILVDVPGKTRHMNEDDLAPDRKAVNLREAVNIVRMHEFHQKAKTVQKNKKATVASAPANVPTVESVSEKSMSQQPESRKPVAVKSTPTVRTQHLEKTAIPEDSYTPDKPKEDKPFKLHTVKPVRPLEEESAADSAADYPPEKTHKLLEEVLQHLKSNSRIKLYDDFSVFKLMAFMSQVIALTCIVVSLVFWLSPDPSGDKVQIMILYGIILQLLVIALLLMHKRD